MRKIIALVLLLLLTLAKSFSASVDTLSIHSKSMKKEIKCTVITPENYTKEKLKYPVVYLLHGYSGNYSTWATNGKAAELADLYNLIIVCPDGGFNSWYWDSPIDKNIKYETHIINEVIPYVDSNYRTIAKKEGRAISGLSMGGQGALYLAIRHQELFVACGSQSGGVDIRHFPNNWEISKILGEYTNNSGRWEKQAIVNMLHLIEPNSLQIIIDCGKHDFFIEVNENLHKKLDDSKIPHVFTVSPGKHNWEYWRHSIKYQLLFFSENFKICKQKNEKP
jgi:S-formylglutathione hydrolase FrmB